MPVFAGGPDARNRPWPLSLRTGTARPAVNAASGSARPTSAARTVLAFLGLLLLLFAVAFAVGRQAGPVAPDLRKPGPPRAPVPMGEEGGGGHGRMGLGTPAGAAPALALGAPAGPTLTLAFGALAGPAPALPLDGGAL
ncbi:hypothetical protein [Embleya scabrispora]|uniref:hypothetical protein n=1 Tax=Embleya scabrispora TaxID=159449 RepID=UPI00037069A5|nr:hypothetical protein [Embleya scabrispora]MYS87336.1 hypothetical protein [Streptomyces sp. SID5474]